jgi:uncharacterized membrane protein
MSLHEEGPRAPLPGGSAPTGGGWFEPGKNNIMLIYGLYLVSAIVGVTAFVGLIMAYMSRGTAQPWAETHYTWAIRTFWIGVLYTIISSILALVAIGFLLMILVAIWAIVRIIAGLQKASREEPMPNPQSWLF